MHLSITLLIASALLGFILGIISGLIPGIHVNNIALLLVALSPFLVSVGFPWFYIAVVILSTSITHTFLDIIPSIFLGAPEADTSLAVLPGHKLLMEGRGSEAVRLSAMGSAGSVVISLIMAFPLGFLFMNVYNILSSYIGWVLVLIVILMIATEKGEIIESSLTDLKFKMYAILLFVISGMLGLFAFNSEDIMQPIIKFGETSVLFPLLSGLFGASMLVISLITDSEIPPQQNTNRVELSKKKIVRGMFTGSMAGSFVALLPGVSSAIGTIIARLLIKRDVDSSKEFIVSISGANTADAIFSLIALFTIQKARSGAMVAIDTLIQSLDISTVVVLLMVVVYVSVLSYCATIYLGDKILNILYKINYQKLCCVILFSLSLMVVLFTGMFGLMIFLVSIPIGMIASFARIRRVHAMGVILLPVILYFF